MMGVAVMPRATTLTRMSRGAHSIDREIADIVRLVALNVLTGAFNLVAGLEPEKA
jgi:hypothetical protein